MICFFDTNVLVYLFDTSDPVRQQQATACFQSALEQHTVALSTQVLQEFFVVTTRKLKPALPTEVAAEQVKQFCAFDVMDSTAHSVCAAIDLANQHQLSWWDALVLEAAIRSKAQVLYSEDFSHGQRFGALTVVNPFQPTPSPLPGTTT
jgi:predicted nucleic acid-binding protein